MTDTAQVCVLNTRHDYFDYAVGAFNPVIGARVWVPFRHNTRLGVVVSRHPPENNRRTLKTIQSVIDDTPLITNELLHLCHFISTYYHATLAEVLALTLPKLYREGRPIITTYAPIAQSVPPPTVPLTLHREQQQALETLRGHLTAYHCFLLHGVTGSGKTEVYLQLVESVLALRRQVLIIVPEIGLTPQLLERFQARFPVPIGVMHSHLTDTQRLHAWQGAHNNTVHIILGTRTALFTPMPNLGLIIIDEEHDASLKQMDGVRYSARDAALVRAQLHSIPIVLGSATPSLESLYNCQTGKYTELQLTHKALNQTPLHMQLIDIRNQKLRHGLSETTQRVIEEHVLRKQQVLIFINRRGFSPVLLCHACGWIANCTACDSHLTFHRHQKILLCHHCGRKQTAPTQCQTCNSDDLVPVGAGTQRVHQGLIERFPNVTMLRIDRDEVTTTRKLNERLSAIQHGAPQLIIGTQMLAKGHHFPNLTLVVVLDTDAGFYNHDFRALERLGQLITQVSGRAGRADQPGRVLIQTHLPHHPLLNQLVQSGYSAFSQTLLQLRAEAEWPPYAFLALLRARGKDPEKLTEFLNTIKMHIQGATILGPAPAPMARKAANYHMQLLIKAKTRPALQAVLLELRAYLASIPSTRAIRWSIDRDPQDLA